MGGGSGNGLIGSKCGCGTNSYNIAIDGVAAAGKGTYSKALAEIFGCKLLDAGSMYRAASVFFLENNIKPEYVKEHLNLIQNMDYDGENPYVNEKIYLPEKIRTEEISSITPIYGKNPEFKDLIIEAQKRITSQSKGWVAEGRNIAYSVMKGNCDLKMYLYADPLVRSLRRLRQQNLPDYDIRNCYDSIIKRDDDDYNHQPSLMRPELAKDQYDYFVDTTKGTKGQVLLNLVTIIREGLPEIEVNRDKLETLLANQCF